jgi:hypothetical protein
VVGAAQRYVDESFCLDKSAGGYPNAHPAFSSHPAIVHAIETYMPVTPILSQGMKLDIDSWGPDGLLQLYFPTHLKAALLSEPPDAITSFGLPEYVDVAFQLNETHQLFTVRGWVERCGGAFDTTDAC